MKKWIKNEKIDKDSKFWKKIQSLLKVYLKFFLISKICPTNFSYQPTKLKTCTSSI